MNAAPSPHAGGVPSFPYAPPLAALDALLAAAAERPHRLVEISQGQDLEPLVPGAIRLGISDFAGPEGENTGRQPLPDHARLIDALTEAGIAPGTALLLYARRASDLSIAARGWVTLRWAGVNNARVLDQPAEQWAAPQPAELAAWATASGSTPPPEAPATFEQNPSVIATIEQVATRSTGTVLIDARAPEAYGGADSHIPGALNLPTGLLVGDGGFLSPQEIREAYRSALDFDDLEDQEIILSCGSGISASLQALALASAGIAAPVYIGSWSEWSKLRR